MRLRSVIRSVLSRTLLRRNTILPFVRGRRYVFVYHDLSEADEAHHHPVYSTPLDTFKHHVAFLRSLFRLVSLGELLASPVPRGDDNLAAIVFDDGFKSVREHAYPHLSSLSIPFAVFVNKAAIETNALWFSDVVLGRYDTAYMTRLFEAYIDLARLTLAEFLADPLTHLIASPRLGEDYSIVSTLGRARPEVFMTAEDIRFLRGHGVTVGSHTVSHRVSARLDGPALEEEIVGNARFLADLLGERVEHFAIPFGFEGTYDQRALRVARSVHRRIYSTARHHFTYADTLRPGFLVPRIGLRRDTLGEIMLSVNLPFFVRRQVLNWT